MRHSKSALRLQRNAKSGSTFGTHKAYDREDFVAGCQKMKVTPHVAKKKSGGAIDKRTTRHEGYKLSQKIRKRFEEGFGWAKTVGRMRKSKLIGRDRVFAQMLLGFSVFNTIWISSLSGWWRGAHT